MQREIDIEKVKMKSNDREMEKMMMQEERRSEKIRAYITERELK